MTDKLIRFSHIEAEVKTLINNINQIFETNKIKDTVYSGLPCLVFDKNVNGIEFKEVVQVIFRANFSEIIECLFKLDTTKKQQSELKKVIKDFNKKNKIREEVFIEIKTHV